MMKLWEVSLQGLRTIWDIVTGRSRFSDKWMFWNFNDICRVKSFEFFAVHVVTLQRTNSLKSNYSGR